MDSVSSVPPEPPSPSSLTMRQAFLKHVFPELDERAVATIKEYLALINHWEKFTNNPPIETLNKKIIKAFRLKLVTTTFVRGKEQNRRRSPSTVNKIMRTLSALVNPLWPADRHNPEGLGLVPLFGFPEPLKRQKRLPFTFERKELSALYLATSACKLPACPRNGYRRSHLYNADLWRAALVLALNIGARTWDLFALKWSDVRWDDYRYGSVWFTSQKTGKVQRIPLNKTSMLHLKFLQKLAIDPDNVFPGFVKNHGFYRAWERICRKAGTVRPFESFRKTANTLYNDLSQGVGAFILGHALKGVNAESYDNPTRRVQKAVYELKLPVEFRRGAKSLAALAD